MTGIVVAIVAYSLPAAATWLLVGRGFVRGKVESRRSVAPTLSDVFRGPAPAEVLEGVVVGCMAAFVWPFVALWWCAYTVLGSRRQRRVEDACRRKRLRDGEILSLERELGIGVEERRARYT